ncbi:hypothetical protein E4U51_008020 [Claviceps purpurea]|nr:hypothetical protein E4U51_008020 [Claviceps purpurea]
MGIPIRAIEVRNSGYIENGRFVSVDTKRFGSLLSPMTEQEWIDTIVQPSMNGFEPGAHYDLGTGWSKLKGFTRLCPWRNERPRTVEDLFHATSDYDWSIEDGRLMVYVRFQAAELEPPTKKRRDSSPTSSRGDDTSPTRPRKIDRFSPLPATAGIKREKGSPKASSSRRRPPPKESSSRRSASSRRRPPPKKSSSRRSASPRRESEIFIDLSHNQGDSDSESLPSFSAGLSSAALSNEHRVTHSVTTTEMSEDPEAQNARQPEGRQTSQAQVATRKSQRRRTKRVRAD